MKEPKFKVYLYQRFHISFYGIVFPAFGSNNVHWRHQIRSVDPGKSPYVLICRPFPFLYGSHFSSGDGNPAGPWQYKLMGTTMQLR